MSIELTTTVSGAFLAGLATSLHCAGMCGPLACAVCNANSGCSPTRSALLYHVGRMFSYMICGATAGALGTLIRPRLPDEFLRIAAWVLLGVLLVALVWTVKQWPRPDLTKRFLRGKSGAGWLGLFTPMIPCGPLYIMLALCALSGSAIRGAMLALAFALGTVPLLWIAQHSWGHIQQRLGPGRSRWLQQAAFTLAMGMLIWRLWATEGCCGSGSY